MTQLTRCGICLGFYLPSLNSSACHECFQSRSNATRSPQTGVSRSRRVPRQRTDRMKTPPIEIRPRFVSQGTQTLPTYEDQKIEALQKWAELHEIRVEELAVENKRLEMDYQEYVTALKKDYEKEIAGLEDNIEILMTPVNSPAWDSGRLGRLFQDRVTKVWGSGAAGYPSGSPSYGDNK